MNSESKYKFMLEPSSIIKVTNLRDQNPIRFFVEAVHWTLDVFGVQTLNSKITFANCNLSFCKMAGEQI